MNEVRDKRVLVTGHTELLGCHIDRALRKFAPEAVWCLQRREFAALSFDGFIDLLQESRAEIVIHLCDLNGGRDRPQDETGGGSESDSDDPCGLYNALSKVRVAKCVLVGSSLAYPPVATIPWSETEFSNHPPTTSHSPSVLSQREFLLRGIEAAERQELPIVTLLAAELYGPGGESRRQTRSLVEGLVREMFKARDADRQTFHLPISGTQSRDFLFVRDAAEAIALVTAGHARPSLVNIGTGIETTIGSVVEMIAADIGYSGKVAWGQQLAGSVSRQCLDCRCAVKNFGFSAATRLDTGIRDTIAWHERQTNRPSVVAR